MNNERKSCDIMILNINISKNNGDTGTVHDVKSNGPHSKKVFSCGLQSIGGICAELTAEQTNALPTLLLALVTLLLQFAFSCGSQNIGRI